MPNSFLAFLESMSIAMEADDITAETANEVAQKALLSEVAIRKGKVKDRENKIKELRESLDKVSGDYIISVDDMLKKYCKAREGNFDELKRCLFRLIRKIFISNEEIVTFIDLGNFITNYSEDVIYKIKIERDKVAFNRFSKKLM